MTIEDEMRQVLCVHGLDRVCGALPRLRSSALVLPLRGCGRHVALGALASERHGFQNLPRAAFVQIHDPRVIVLFCWAKCHLRFGFGSSEFDASGTLSEGAERYPQAI